MVIMIQCFWTRTNQAIEHNSVLKTGPFAELALSISLENLMPHHYGQLINHLSPVIARTFKMPSIVVRFFQERTMCSSPFLLRINEECSNSSEPNAENSAKSTRNNSSDDAFRVRSRQSPLGSRFPVLGLSFSGAVSPLQFAVDIFPVRTCVWRWKLSSTPEKKIPQQLRSL